MVIRNSKNLPCPKPSCLHEAENCVQGRANRESISVGVKLNATVDLLPRPRSSSKRLGLKL